MQRVVLLVLLFVALCTAASRTRTMVNPGTGRVSTITYTEQGVPFITSPTEPDLFFTQGYVVAENRLWQMEFFRRVALGRLAEIFGERLVETDKSFRRMQFGKVATANMANTPASYIEKIQHYMDGANAFLSAASLDPTLMPPEFAEYEAPFPAPFQVLDSFLIVKVLAAGLSGNARSEPGNQRLLDRVGLERYQYLMARDPALPYVVPPYQHSNYSRADSSSQFKEHKTIIQDFPWEDLKIFNHSRPLPFNGVNTVQQPGEVFEGELGEFLKVFNPPEFTLASNSWAIGGEHTSTGGAMFSNDPHLLYTAPMVWFMVGLHVDSADSTWSHIIGATLIYAPGVGIGRNDHISWGYTMVSADNQDLYVMDNLPGNTRYRYNETIINYEITNDVILVKGADPVNVTLYWSVYGPTIPSGETYYSLHWSGTMDVEPSVQALIDQNYVTTYQEYLQACSKWWSLCFNAVFADTQGNIGYKTTGAIPHRQPGDNGELPKPGDGSRNWLGFIDFGNLPLVVNPPEGFIVSANNPVAPKDQEVYPIYGTFAIGFRAQRIIDMIVDAIKAGTKIDVAYSSSIQGSVINLEFSYLYSTVQHLVLSDQKSLDWQQTLLGWDGNELTTSQEATLFEEFTDCLYNVTFYEIGYSWSDPYFGALVFNNATADGTGDDVACGYWNETCLTYASNCFAASVAKYPIRIPEFGAFPHYAAFPHLLPVPVQGYSRAVSVGGSPYTPNAAHPIAPRGPILAGPSMRMVSDMSGLVPNQIVLPMGESGVPSSPYYADQLATWAADQLYVMDWNYLD